MTTTRARLALLLEGSDFPLHKADLLSRVDEDGDADLAAIVRGLHGEHYASREELDYLLEDALGMPDAFPGGSALAAEIDWSADDPMSVRRRP